MEGFRTSIKKKSLTAPLKLKSKVTNLFYWNFCTAPSLAEIIQFHLHKLKIIIQKVYYYNLVFFTHACNDVNYISLNKNMKKKYMLAYIGGSFLPQKNLPRTEGPLETISVSQALHSFYGFFTYIACFYLVIRTSISTSRAPQLRKYRNELISNGLSRVLSTPLAHQITCTIAWMP